MVPIQAAKSSDGKKKEKNGEGGPNDRTDEMGGHGTVHRSSSVAMMEKCSENCVEKVYTAPLPRESKSVYVLIKPIYFMPRKDGSCPVGGGLEGDLNPFKPKSRKLYSLTN